MELPVLRSAWRERMKAKDLEEGYCYTIRWYQARPVTEDICIMLKTDEKEVHKFCDLPLAAVELTLEEFDEKVEILKKFKPERNYGFWIPPIKK